MSSSATWEEIKRLAADFQRIQLIDSTYKLSDRNCIQLVNKLTSFDLINIFHTLDGKEYVTEEQIRKEIYDEIYVNGGRVNVISLQSILNVDITHIEKKVYEIIKNDPDLVLAMGQILSKTYINKIAEDINDVLQERTLLAVSELSTFYELSPEFLHQVLTQRIGTIVKGFLDNQVLYTDEYVNKNKSILAGHLEASVRPVLITQLMKDKDIESKMCFSTLNTLLDGKHVNGSLIGSGKESVFIPVVYNSAQKSYTESFFKQNGYLEYRALKKIGITDAEQYAKANFSDLNVHYLSSCCITPHYANQIEANVEDALRSYGYCDVSHNLPPVFTDKDAAMLLSHLMKQSDDVLQLKPVVLTEKVLVTEEYRKNLIESLKDEMEQKAISDLKNPNVLLILRASQTGATSGSKSGGGKTKGKSKKQAADSKQGAVDFADLNVDFTFISDSQLRKKITEKDKDIPDDVVEAIVDHTLSLANQKYVEVLNSKFEAGGVVEGATGSAAGASKEDDSPKNLFKDTQEKIKTLLVHSKVFDNAIKKFPNEKGHDLLRKHLIRTLCSDMCHVIFKYVASENIIQMSEDNTPESRNKVIQKVKEPVKGLLVQLNTGLAEKSSTEMIALIESIAGDVLELQLKKFDQKKEKEVLLELNSTLSSQLEKESDPAIVLQVASILIYFTSTSVILNPPGKCVPMIVEALKPHLNDEANRKLAELQNMITTKASPETAEELISQVKKIALDAKTYLKPT